MARYYGTRIDDVGGSFKRFLQNAPKEARQELAAAVKKAAFIVGQRMKATAPVGPEAPHLRDDVEVAARGLTARVGYLTAKPAGADTDATQPEVALFNEYAPNKQPFMRSSADASASEFVREAKAAIGRVERTLTGGGLL